MTDGNCYKNRLDDLRRAQSEAESFLLRNYYAHAINLTEESLCLLADLVERGMEKFEEDKRLVDQRLAGQSGKLEQIAKQLEEAKQDLATKTDDLSRSIATLKLKMLRTSLTLDVSGINTELLMIGSSIRLNVVPGLTEQLFNNILCPDETYFQLEAVIEGINFVIGLVPFLGNVYSGLLAINGITTNRKRIRKAADKHVVYLEAYCHALKIWIVAAQSAIRSLQVIDND
ncbi:MAG: hypothetical protein ACREYE_21385 [Gammaproteobacteria bacterium]